MKRTVPAPKLIAQIVDLDDKRRESSGANGQGAGEAVRFLALGDDGVEGAVLAHETADDGGVGGGFAVAGPKLDDFVERRKARASVFRGKRRGRSARRRGAVRERGRRPPAWERMVRSIPFAAMAGPVRRRNRVVRRCVGALPKASVRPSRFSWRVHLRNDSRNCFIATPWFFQRNCAPKLWAARAIDAALRQRAHGGGDGLGRSARNQVRSSRRESS